jgi:hypothetical protein
LFLLRAGEVAEGRHGFMHVANQPLGDDGLHALLVTGSFILDIDGDTLTGTFLDLNGEVRDEFWIVKSPHVKPDTPA